jgi:protein gp37
VGDKSSIEWTDASWNPTTGCDRVSPGCANCYALTLSPRLKAMALALGKHVEPTDPYMRDGDPKTSGPGFGLMLHENRLDMPLRWQRPRRIFVNSMSDLFHPEVPDEFIDKVFAVMALARQHTFQVLTKRPERMREYMNESWGDGRTEPMHTRVDVVWTDIAGIAQHEGLLPKPPSSMVDRGGVTWEKYDAAVADLAERVTWPLPNVWLGTSVENARWRSRVDELRHVPAAVRFLSCEPLLGPLVRHDDGRDMPTPLDLTGIDWVIIGGESGPGARPMSEAWVRDIVEECRRQGVAPFVKQLGDTWSREHLGHPGHGGKIETFPEDLQVREFPRVKVAA